MLNIIYENKEILVVNKLAGLAVQPGAKITNSVISLLKENLPYEPYLVHRLDKETSGALLVAKTPVAAKKFSTLMAGRNVSKTYWAVCGGIPLKKQGEINTPIRHEGIEKNALTYYRVLKTFGGKYSLIEAKLGTGRMHQIRIHLAGIGCPIIGDDRYGNFALNKQVRKEFGIKKMMLHAYELIIPTNNRIVAEEPDYYRTFFSSFSNELSEL